MRLRASLAALATLCALAATATRAEDHPGAGTPVAGAPMVGPGPWVGSFGGWPGAWQPPYAMPYAVAASEPAAGPPAFDREGWLKDCRRRLADNGLGGAVIGGVLGGVGGHALAGHGNRALGTVAGAAVGAVAGAAIDQAEDRARARDRCEAMLEGGAAYGYAPAGYAMMMVPVMMVPLAPAMGTSRECTETVVTEEYVPVPVRRSRHIPPRAPDKRVKIVPDKRTPQ